MADEFTLLGMKVGDLATWLGAMGSFAAVVTALRLAKSDGRRRDREAEAKGRVIAAFLFAEVGAMNARVEAAIDRAEACKTFTDERAMHAIDRVRELIDGIDAMRFANNLDKLADLPGGHGQFLAAVPDMKRVITTACGWNVPFPLPHDAHAKAADLLPQLRAMKQSADRFMTDYEPKFAID